MVSKCNTIFLLKKALCVCTQNINVIILYHGVFIDNNKAIRKTITCQKYPFFYGVLYSVCGTRRLGWGSLTWLLIAQHFNSSFRFFIVFLLCNVVNIFFDCQYFLSWPFHIHFATVLTYLSDQMKVEMLCFLVLYSDLLDFDYNYFLFFPKWAHDRVLGLQAGPSQWINEKKSLLLQTIL